MIIVILIIIGLAMGSFVNALTWRIFMLWDSDKTQRKIKGYQVNLSIVNGRSVCVHCGHELSPLDLVPFFSWLFLGGKCRYCHQKIDDSPIVELVMASLFVASYIYWPSSLITVGEYTIFSLWLLLVIGLVALTVYDLKHLILPNKILFPLFAISTLFRLSQLVVGDLSLSTELLDIVYGLLVGGGLFYLLFQVSKGRWIGGGDVKLGFLIGLTLGPLNALIALFSAFYSSAFVVFPLMLIGKVNRKSKIPFGPFLIAGFIVAMLWGENIYKLYNDIFGI